jgi:DNA-binding GntR family transcriptional regulator
MLMGREESIRIENRRETRSLAEQVYQSLCNRIIEGSINYGECLNIKLIAREMNVSPMPVREAIKRLEMEGLVIVKPRSTCLVRIPTRKSILSALDMRELLEIHCAEAIYPTVDAGRLKTLRGITQTMRESVEKANQPQVMKEYIKLDRQFHTELCSIAENDFIDKAYRETNLHLNMSFIYNVSIPPDVAGTYQAHVELVEALARNSKLAVSIIKKHLRRSRQNVLSGALFSSLQDAPLAVSRA